MAAVKPAPACGNRSPAPRSKLIFDRWRAAVSVAVLLAAEVSKHGLRDLFALEAMLGKLTVGHARQGLEALRHRAGLADAIEEGRNLVAEPLQERRSTVDQLVQGKRDHGIRPYSESLRCLLCRLVL